MANNDNPNGLQAYNHESSPGNTLQSAPIASGYGVRLGVGDPIKLVSGNVQRAAAGDTDIEGVFAGCSYTDSTGRTIRAQNWTENTVSNDAVAEYFRDPNMIYRVQFDEGVGLDDINKNYDLIVVDSRSKGNSKVEVDTSTGTGTGSAQVRLVGFPVDGANELDEDNVEGLVKINEHTLNSRSGS